MKTNTTPENTILLPASVSTTLSDWDVYESPIFGQIPDVKSPTGFTTVELDGEKAILRNDNGQTLNVCKPGYTPYTNAQFIDVVERFSEITKYPVEEIYEIAGGRKMLGYLKVNKPMTVGGFEFKDHLMIGNSHDGSTGFFVGNSNIMVRCQNRFAREFRQLKAKHTQKLHVTVEDIVAEFRNYQMEMNKYYHNLEEFKKVKVSKKLMESLRNRMANLSNEEILGRKEITSRKQNIMDSIDRSFEGEMQAVGFDLFGLFEGVTHYTTHGIKNHALDVNLGMFDRSQKISTDAYEFCKDVAHKAKLQVM